METINIKLLCKYCNHEMNEKLKCKGCNIEIDKKIGNARLCNDCNNKRFREYYKKNIVPNKQYTKKKGYEKIYKNENEEEIILTLTSDIKKCRLCNEFKNFDSFNFINNKYKDNVKKYLGPDCKECLNKLLNDRKEYIKNIQRQNNMITNNILETPISILAF